MANEMEERRSGIVAGLMAVVSTLVGMVMVRMAAVDLNGFELTLLRMWAGVVVLLILFGRKIQWKKLILLSRKDKLLLVLNGVLIWSGGILLYNFATLDASLLNVTLVMSFQPVVIYLMALMFLKDRFSWQFLVYIVMSIYGVMMVGGRSFTPSLFSIGKGELMALGAVMFLSVSFVVRKYFSEKLDVYEISIVTVALAAIGLLVYGAYANKLPVVTGLSNLAWLAILVGGAASAMVGYFNNSALSKLSPAFVSQIGRLSSVGAVIIGILMFAEAPVVTDLVGGLLIVGSVYAAKNIELSG